MSSPRQFFRHRAFQMNRLRLFSRCRCWIRFILPIAIIYIGCGEDLSPEDTTPPDRPQIIAKSPETQFLQQGIDSEPGSTDQDYWIRIEWAWNTESDLSGYYVYRMDERDSLGGYPYSRITTLQLGVDLRREMDPIPFYIDKDAILRPDQTTGFSHGFYYYARAYDTSENVSSPSDTVYYRLLKKPRALATSGNTSSTFSLVWEYYSQESWNYFFIRVYPEGFPGNRVWSYRADLLVSPFSVTFNADNSANRDYFQGDSDSLLTGTYAWVVDAVADFDALHPAGAETKATFVVQP